MNVSPDYTHTAHHGNEPTQPAPLVSIITPSYNHARFIGQCIESTLAQGYRNWEQIIIDDGSSDDTGAIVKEFNDPRIRYISQQNQGPFQLAATYNRALSYANGDLIAILEGDDFWPADKLETQVPAFRNSNVVLSHGEVVDVDANGKGQRIRGRATNLRRKLPDTTKQNMPTGSATRYMLGAEGRTLICPASVMIRRQALDRIGGFQSIAGLPLTDYPTFMELSLLGSFHHTDAILGYRRRHEQSITVNYSREIHDKVCSFSLEFLERYGNALSIDSSHLLSLKRSWTRAESAMHFSQGRSLLLKRSWPQARSCFGTALRAGRPSIRIAALAGILCSWFHIDLESLAHIGGTANLKLKANVGPIPESVELRTR